MSIGAGRRTKNTVRHTGFRDLLDALERMRSAVMIVWMHEGNAVKFAKVDKPERIEKLVQEDKKPTLT
jgi:hypothetical protein